MFIFRWLKKQFMNLFMIDYPTQLEYLDAKFEKHHDAHILMLHRDTKMITFVTVGKSDTCMGELIEAVDTMHTFRGAVKAEREARETKEQADD